MLDLSEYDRSVVTANAKVKSAIMPLLSWDLYSVYFRNLKGNHADFAQLEQMAALYKWNLSLNLLEELHNNDAIIVTNIALEIEFASEGIAAMTGYQPLEVVGKSPKLFQGKATSEEKRAAISLAIASHKPFETTLINYKKTGEPYDCHIRSFPIFNKKGQLSHFIALEKAA